MNYANLEERRTLEGINHSDGAPSSLNGSKVTNFPVNPVLRIDVRGFWALLFQGARNLHSRAYARGVLCYGVNVCTIKIDNSAVTGLL